jgi:hypothetical protein
MLETEWRNEFKCLWRELVPSEGQANTVQGELIRAVGRLKDEAFRNGNQNFGKSHRTLCKYIREIMTDPAVFNRDEIAEIDTWITRVLDADHPDVLGPATCFHHLFEMAVRWCQSHPDLIPRVPSPALRIGRQLAKGCCERSHRQLVPNPDFVLPRSSLAATAAVMYGWPTIRPER